MLRMQISHVGWTWRLGFAMVKSAAITANSMRTQTLQVLSSAKNVSASASGTTPLALVLDMRLGME